jgi:hypothetical protein
MNSKTKRLLDAIAIVLKDERPRLIEAVHKVVTDKRDGYPYDFKLTVENYKHFIQGGRPGGY